MFRIEYDQIVRHSPMPFFYPRQPPYSRQKYYGLAPPTSKFQPTPPTSPRPKFLWTNATHAKIWPTLPTNSCYLRHPRTRFPRVSYLMFSVQTLEHARFKIKMREIHHKESFCRKKYRFHSRSKEKSNAIHFNNDFLKKFLNESKIFFLVYNSVII